MMLDESNTDGRLRKLYVLGRCGFVVNAVSGPVEVLRVIRSKSQEI